jgi:aminoglycoside phosphotransferase (APT) family kinase protein
VPADPRPAAEVEVTADLVRRLLAEQHPDLAGRPLVPLASGWDNVLYRLRPAPAGGSAGPPAGAEPADPTGGPRATGADPPFPVDGDLVVRLPRRALSAPLVLHEQRWLAELAPRLPVPVPVPLRVGRPADGYPWSWSVCPWLDGTPAIQEPPLDAQAVAGALGRFLRALHHPAPPTAPRNPYRGTPLGARDDGVRQRVAQLDDVLDAPAVLACWAELMAAPPWAGPPLWVHGDLHPGNVLVRDGRLSAVIDFGDLTAGDPATDLAVAWSLLPAAARPALRAAAGPVADATWTRARGWALALGLAYLAGSSDDAAMTAMGRRTVAAALAGGMPA